MVDLRTAFFAIPDYVIVTDLYLYIIDFNKTGMFGGIKKGKSIKRYLTDTALGERELEKDGRVYNARVSHVMDGGRPTGYIFYFSDITEKRLLLNEINSKSDELAVANQRISDANKELAEYAREIEEIADDAERIQIARHIHDNAGHAMTVLHTISQMCRILQGKDEAQYRALIQEGIRLCEDGLDKSRRGDRDAARQGLEEALRNFAGNALFPVKLSVNGKEPEWGARISGGALKICKEAYHNTLSHTMADCLFIDLTFGQDAVTLRITDNGKCGKVFSKGFGLTHIEETARSTNAGIEFEHIEGQGFGITIRWTDKGALA